MKEIITIKKALDNAELEIQSANLDHAIPSIDASVLLMHVLAKPKSYLLTWHDKVLTIGQLAMYQALVERRVRGEPVAYITGQKEFFSMMFAVDENTLIPRPETELLVENVLEKLNTKSKDHLQILDLGTGSGAIAVAIAKARANWQVTAVDQSLKALEMARKNAKANKAHNIDFLYSDWTANLPQESRFDCIVSNPPYIDKNDIHLQQGDLKFEPKTALVSENNGLADIEKILKQAVSFLKPDGLLLLEHGYDQQAAIEKLIKDLGIYSDFEFIKDYADLSRIVFLRKNNDK